MKLEDPPRITINALFSLQVVVLMVTLAVWIIRLSDKVESHERLSKINGKKHSNYELRLFLLEEKTRMPHPKVKDEDGD